ncbi:TRNA-dihydrouridine(16 17) synthase [NAD(P)(+)] [Micractinium conductrix]|uniref:tRNA-dihydrouridine(16/17) synthase [NAD(P)(+)] n=1 Tax=Micractinium conductrix TaxID=554055 RepID=A0A2P6V6T4_9CHLO|nr:TRNA-dihydrouridine(16 17) synthase [NAD(P)(+)] [Micractinium conductrix]|eukprot:PSC69788.1 TRNA-dihydrouridine(16 17) synthase [NAD(P)(+)] [Micractinium conductrix]
MVDQSELAFRQLCRRHGATGAYTPMLHARLFLETPAYRAEHFTTATQDRPLLTQFCANDPEVLVKAAKLVEAYSDGVDLNLGCPQRIARRGKYGAFLMDDLPLVERMVRALSSSLSVPVTVKIRRFDEKHGGIAKTIAYAQMLERAGASLLAIHGRTREQKRASEVLAEWEYIKAVKQSLRIPVLGNGNIRTLADCHALMDATGVDGVMSAESLLVDPALFSARRLTPGGAHGPLDGCHLLLEYCDLLDLHPTPWRMVKGHAFQMLGAWLTEFTDMREQLNRGQDWDTERLRDFALEALARIEATGRDHPVPALSARALARMEAEAGLARAIEEQQREEQGLAAIGGGGIGDGCGDGCGGAGAGGGGGAAAAAADEKQAALAGA